MVGSLVATSDDSSSLDLLILRSSESYNGEYISIDEKYIYFKPSSSLAKQAVEKTMIEKVVLSDGTVIFDYVKSIDRYMLESDDQNLLLLKKNKDKIGGGLDKIGDGLIMYKNKIGGGLIALGSGLLIYNTNRECNNCGLDFNDY